MRFIIIFLGFFMFLNNANAFELNKYLGLWNEIYSIPNSFQKDCYNVSAEYVLKENGNIKVINSCRTKDSQLKKSIEGEAVIKDLSKRYLKVYFFRPFGLNIFGGDYYVLGLADDYSWAIVGTPDHKYGWILSRSKTLDDQLLNTIKLKAVELGFKWDQFVKTTFSE